MLLVSNLKATDTRDYGHVVATWPRRSLSPVPVSRQTFANSQADFWEGPAFNGWDSKFQSDVLDYLRYDTRMHGSLYPN